MVISKMPNVFYRGTCKSTAMVLWITLYEMSENSYHQKGFKWFHFRNALKTAENFHHIHKHPDFQLSSAKIRCCHLRNLISRCDMKCFDSVVALCMACVGWPFYFRNLEDCLTCSPCSLADDWQACHSVGLSPPFKADPWKRPPSDTKWLLTRVRFDSVLVGFSLSLPWLCSNILHLSENWFSRIILCKNLYKTDVLNRKIKNHVYNAGGGNKVCLFMCK